MKNIILIILLSVLGFQLAVASDVTDIFEPFQKKTHRKLIKNFGVSGATDIYNDYIEEKIVTSNCEELIGSCDYYLCQEKKTRCGSKGYFLNFGYQYCSKSLKILSPIISQEGKLWLKDTATCLQEQIEDLDLGSMSCKEIKKAAIKGHDKCYTEYSFCSLSFKDIKKIMKMVFPALTKRGVIIEGVQVLKYCISRK